MGFEELKNLPSTMDSSNNDLVADFFVPVLKEAISYDRGVGFFTSGWLTSASKGLIRLVENGGKVRFITSPMLEKKDFESIRLGNTAAADEVIYKALERNIIQLEKDLKVDVRNALAWMVADDLLEFRFAIPSKKLEGGDFHVKFGIFRDANNDRIAFTGSYNDSKHANLNFEELTIFKSNDKNAMPVIEQKERMFERLWDGNDPNIKVYTITESIKNRIMKLRTNTNRPYRSQNRSTKKINKPSVPDGLTPFEHQNDAIRQWELAQRKGVLEMATGTGKTKTAFFAVIRLMEPEESLITVVACPQKSLAVQWLKECREFNMKALLASSDNSKWKDEMNNIVSKSNLGLEKYCTIVCTHETLKSDTLNKAFERLNKDKVKSLLIADECHHLGAQEAREKACQKFDFTLGLSATPTRLYDKDGSDFVESYLGKIIYKFPLKMAIDKGILCGYEYYAHPVYLDDDESDEYIKISQRISQMVGSTRGEGDIGRAISENKSLQNMIYRRANILKKAKMKLEKLEELVKERRESINHAVIFCVPDTDELERTAQLLSSLGIVSHRFTGSESTEEREQILNEFDRGTYQVITSMTIFNEGIDVPSTREAFFLASSTNPAEFVQRRGRVLRKPKGINKEKAVLHDFIVLPPIDDISKITKFEKQMVRKELQRFYVFAEDAMNSISEMTKIDDIIRKYFQVDFV
jgi:superfamily II DNA or RNA helicase